MGKEKVSNYDLQVDIGKRLFLDHDQERLIRKFRLEADREWIYLTYLNTPCRLSRATGAMEELRAGQWRECRSYATVMTVYDLLCYHRGEEMPDLSGHWCTAGTFIVTGITKTEDRESAAFFDGHPEKLRAACERLGGVILPPMAGADVSCRIPVMPFFPVLLQFWSSDEEFPAKILILWDRNADRFLHFETTFYLQGDLLERLRSSV